MTGLDGGASPADYNHLMARGWESKSIAEQQEEAVRVPAEQHVILTPEQLAARQSREGLRLCRERILQQLEVASNPRYRQMLQAALAELDAKLSVMA